MKRFLLFSLLFVFACNGMGVVAADYSVGSFLFRPLHEAFFESNTDLVFPDVLGEFRKSRVSINQNLQIGTTIRYLNEAGDSADVYVYSTDEKAKIEDMTDEKVKSVFEKSVNAIVSLPKQSSSVLSVERLSDDVGKNQAVDACSAVFRLKLKDETLYSILTILGYQGMFLKIRVSCDASADDAVADSRKFVSAVLQLVADARQKEKSAVETAQKKFVPDKNEKKVSEEVNRQPQKQAESVQKPL